MAKKRRRIKTGKIRNINLLMFAGFVVVVSVFVIGISNDAVNLAESSAQPNGLESQQKAESAFTGCYYYEKDKLDRYRRYQRKHPEMLPGDVVWQVNAGLDREVYDEGSLGAADTTAGGLILVTKHFGLEKDYVPKHLVELPNELKAERKTAKAYVRLEKAAKRAGYYLYAQSAYRSYEKQDKLQAEYKGEDSGATDEYSARAGYSEHQTGLAIDVNKIGLDYLEDFAGTPEAQWLAENAHRFGFIVRYTEENAEYTGYSAEPWHIRYIGKKHASVIYEKGIKTFEEYKVKYLDHHQKMKGE